MKHMQYTAAMLSAGVTMFTATATAQDYPTKVVHIVTAQVGGSQDFGARQIAAGLTQSMGQQVVVEPRQGGTIGG